MQATRKDPYAESSTPPSQIEELYQHIREFRRFPKDYRAIHMHFSVLDRLHQQPHHRRAIATAFNKLISPYEGRLFWMQNFDFFFVCKGCPHSKLEQAKFDALRAVDDSPVLKKIIATSRDDEICDWFDLTIEYEKFYELVEKLRREFANSEIDTDKSAPDLKKLIASLDPDADSSVDHNENIKKTPDAPQKKRTIPQYDHIFNKDVTPNIGPLELDKLERNIKSMDMYALIDQQDICVIMESMEPQVVFTKKFISLEEVNHHILPGYNIGGDKWLFQRLTETFDQKMMQALTDYKSFPDNVLSINMNVSTVSSKEFDNFIKNQKMLSKHPLVIEFTLFDIMSDLTAYYNAQKKLNQLGCKICICKMDVQSLYILDRELINVDFLKIRWNKSYLTALSATDREKIINTIKAQGKMRVVLSDCDTEKAIQFGRSLGIVMFQGFEVDKLQQ